MGTVSAGAAISLDGFIADPSGEVGPLFDWYFNGDVDFPTAGGRWVFKTSQASAKHLREIWNSAGALVVGRGEFDKTQAWGGLHPLGVPVFVLTHRPPPEWPFPETPPTEDAPFTFVTEGIENAIAQAQATAGDKVVGVNPGSIAGQTLNAGLLDEVWVELVPRAARRWHPVLRRRGEAAGAVREPARDRGGRGDAPDLYDQAPSLSSVG